jgi:hypothetical protein
MDYGNDTHLDSSAGSKRPDVGNAGANSPAQQANENKPAKSGAAAGAIACDIKHPLAAILANANAARRWLNGPDASLAEAMAALDQITRDVARIDAAVDAIAAMPVDEAGKRA